MEKLCQCYVTRIAYSGKKKKNNHNNNNCKSYSIHFTHGLNLRPQWQDEPRNRYELAGKKFVEL